MVKETPVAEIDSVNLNQLKKMTAIGTTFKRNQKRTGPRSPAPKKRFRGLSLEKSIRAAFWPLDTRGYKPSHTQRVRLIDLAFCLTHHPIMQKINSGTPGISKEARRRRRHDALKRAIKAIPEIRREGSTKDSYYVYDSTAVASDAITSAVLEQIIRFPPGNASDIIREMDMMDSDQLIDSLHHLEGQGAIDFDDYKFELKQGIWEIKSGGKRTLTITLPDHTLNLFGELATRFTAVQEFITRRGHQGPVSFPADSEYIISGQEGAGLDLNKWHNSTRQGQGVSILPFPMTTISKSMIVEIALWNLWKQHNSPSQEPVDASKKGLKTRQEIIEIIEDTDEFIALVSRIAEL